MSKFSFNSSNLTEAESLLHVFQFVCGDPLCVATDCGRSVYKSVSKECRKNLDESDMFMMFIEFLTPVNFVCKKCIEKWTFYENIHEEVIIKNNTERSSDKWGRDMRETPRVEVAKKLKDSNREVQVYK